MKTTKPEAWVRNQLEGSCIASLRQQNLCGTRHLQAGPRFFDAKTSLRSPRGLRTKVLVYETVVPGVLLKDPGVL